MAPTIRHRGASRSQVRLTPAAEAAERPRGGSNASFVAHKMTALVLFAAGLWLLHGLLTDDRFAIRQVAVAGAEHISEESVRDLVDPRFAGGNPSLFMVDGQELEQRILDEFGQLERVTVRCSLPGTVHVTLKEREDVLVWESSGRYWWVDGQGRVLATLAFAPPTEGDALPPLIVHDVESWAPEPEGYISGVPWELLRGLREALPAAREYEYSRSLGLVVRVTVASYPVYLGHTGSAETKVAILKALAADLAADGAEVAYVDLRYDHRPLYKLR